MDEAVAAGGAILACAHAKDLRLCRLTPKHHLVLPDLI